MKKDCKKNKHRFNLFALCFNIGFLIIEIILMLSFIIFIGLAICATVILIMECNGADTSAVFNLLDQHSCACPHNCYFNSCNIECSCACYQNYINTLISILSLSFTGVLIPFLSLIITVFISSKSALENLSEELAKAKNINCYLLIFPLGIWGNLSDLYQIYNRDEGKKLSDYSYALHLLFEGEVFQAYETQIKEIKVKKVKNGKDKIEEETLWLDSKDSLSFVSDVTGVKEFEDIQNSGSNLTALIENCNDIKIKNYFIENISDKNKIIFTIKFEEYNIKLSERWKQFHYCVTAFPIIRTIFGQLVKQKRKYIYYDFELTVSEMIPTDERFSQYQLDIRDVNVVQVRKHYKKKEKLK